jgi:uncharacterized iron-regulated membrane protein
MRTSTLKIWAWLHKWTSLICTAFMLLLCLTGLPLIFGHEISHLLGDEIEAPAMPEGTLGSATQYASLDRVLNTARALYPAKVPQFMFREEDETNLWTISLGDTPTAKKSEFITVDARTAKVLGQPVFDQGFMHIMLRLHVDLFAGLPGTLFLGFMGLLLVIAIVSGVVLYAPFMRKLAFGEVRKNRTQKLKRLDTHNFLGIITLVWFLAVGLTGVINTLSDLVVRYWQTDQMAEMTLPYKNLPPLKRFDASLQVAIDKAITLEPSMNLGFVAFPGTTFSSQHHYAVFMRGKTPLTARLFKPVLIDATTAEITDSRVVPWYLIALLVSQPLHFGDYGGMPLKIIWAIFDILSIIVLWTGLLLWWKKRKQYAPDIEARINLNEAY